MEAAYPVVEGTSLHSKSETHDNDNQSETLVHSMPPHPFAELQQQHPEWQQAHEAADHDDGVEHSDPVSVVLGDLSHQRRSVVDSRRVQSHGASLACRLLQVHREDSVFIMLPDRLFLVVGGQVAVRPSGENELLRSAIYVDLSAIWPAPAIMADCAIHKGRRVHEPGAVRDGLVLQFGVVLGLGLGTREAGREGHVFGIGRSIGHEHECSFHFVVAHPNGSPCLTVGKGDREVYVFIASVVWDADPKGDSAGRGDKSGLRGEGIRNESW